MLLKLKIYLPAKTKKLYFTLILLPKINTVICFKRNLLDLQAFLSLYVLVCISVLYSN